MAEIRIEGAAGAKLAQMLEAATPERVGELSGRVAEAEAEVELMLERKAAAEAKARRARARYVAAVKARDELALELAMTAKLAGVDRAPAGGGSARTRRRGRGPPALGRVPPRPRGRAHPAQPRPASAHARGRAAAQARGRRPRSPEWAQRGFGSAKTTFGRVPPLRVGTRKPRPSGRRHTARRFAPDRLTERGCADMAQALSKASALNLNLPQIR